MALLESVGPLLDREGLVLFSATATWAAVFQDIFGASSKFDAAELLRRKRRKSGDEDEEALGMAVLATLTDGRKSCATATSRAFDAVDDKSDLCIALADCGFASSAPRTVCLAWDASCDVSEWPFGSGGLLVLKPSGGYGGEGIIFTDDPQRVVDEVLQHAALTKELPFHEERTHIPGWVVQANVSSALVRQGRKLHLRSYVCVFGNAVCLYVGDHEARVAELPLDGSDDARRFITNGAGGSATLRLRVCEIEEELGFGEGGLQKALEAFLAPVCAALFKNAPEAARRQDHLDFAVAAIDTMLDTDMNFQILEFNVNPAAPPKEACDALFWDHLKAFAADLADSALQGAPCGSMKQIGTLEQRRTA
ncbi:hypothetical protein M885DRAFT_618485 [Pelagophyceae sp. CCMP2097]|nr:hypothetical protein M885DRAFT_618485 [Pelagophyceae sp. CCMP2097]